MKVAEIADMTQAELSLKERELREELFSIKMKAGSGQVEKPARIKAIKRDIARVLTFMNRRIAGEGRRAQQKA